MADVQASQGIAVIGRDVFTSSFLGMLTTETEHLILEWAGTKSNPLRSYRLKILEMGSFMTAYCRSLMALD